MQYKWLGRTNIKLPAIGQGTMGVGGYFTEDKSNDAHSVEMLELGIECDMTLIDTAEAYGAGHSEELVGQVIKGCRKDVFVATKVSPEHLGYKGVLKACEGSLRQLKTDYIDLYQIHWPNPSVPIEGTLKAMGKLVGDGKVRHIGVSNFSLRQLKKANEICRVASIQVEYNLFDRTAELDIIPYCEREKITVLAYSPLEKGRHYAEVPLGVIVKKYSKSVAQIILRWLTQNKQVVAIPKATSIDHIKEDASATSFRLSDNDYNIISDAFECQVASIPTGRIKVSRDGVGNFVPSIEVLARDLLDGETIKPIRVSRIEDVLGQYDYILMEGKLRYWAWVNAYEGIVPIPALVRGEIRNNATRR